MKKQKICIIGGSLTGLITAISLSKLNCKIDLITGNNNRNFKSNRTIAISQNNFNFLKELKIFKYLEKELWPCTKMKLYSGHQSKKFEKIFEINNDHKSKKILYMLENSKFIKIMLKKIKNIKSITLKKNETVSTIIDSGLLQSVELKNNKDKYNLIIICTGSDSKLVKSFFHDESIKNSYGETSITTILNHNSIKNNTARQIFLNREILALLPISNSKTSIVWSVKNSLYKQNNKFIKNKIKFYVKNYLKKIKFSSKIEYRDLNFLIRNKYYQNRTLLFGDALHSVHPFVGQGFNMTIRDLVSLKKTLVKKINLGLDIGSQDVLFEFANETKPRNFAYSLGINFLKNTFSYKNKSVKNFRDNFLRLLNKSDFSKDLLLNIADKGFKF